MVKTQKQLKQLKSLRLKQNASPPTKSQDTQIQKICGIYNILFYRDQMGNLNDNQKVNSYRRSLQP